MFADIAFRSSTLRDLLASILSRVETLDTGMPDMAPVDLRKICSWSPTDQSVAGRVAQLNLNTSPQFLSTILRMREPQPVNVPGTLVSFQPRAGTTNEVMVVVRLEGQTASSEAVVAANLDSPMAAGFGNLVRLLVGVEVVDGPTVMGVTRRQLLLGLRTRFAEVPAAVGGNGAVNGALQGQGQQIPIDLTGIESALGGVSILGANVRCFPADDIMVIRVLFLGLSKFYQAEGYNVGALREEYLAFNDVPVNSYRAQLGNDEITVVTSEQGFGSILVASLDQALKNNNDVHMQTGRHEATIVPDQEGSLSFSAKVDIRISHGCESPLFLREHRPDIVAGVNLRASIQAQGANLQIRAQSAETHPHAGWTLLCGLAHLVYLPAALALGAIGGPVGLAVAGAVSAVGVLAVPIIGSLIRLSPQDIAAYSGRDRNDNPYLVYDPATGEIVRNQPLERSALPIPSAFQALRDPSIPAEEPEVRRLPSNFGEFAVTSISSRGVGRALRIGLRFLGNIAGGSLRARPRPPVGVAPLPNAVPNWEWSYRDCDRRPVRGDVALATSIRIINSPEQGSMFVWNGQRRMELCSLAFTGPIKRLIDRGINPLQFDWLNDQDRLLNAQPTTLLPGNSVALVMSISRETLLDLRLRASGFPNPGGGAGIPSDRDVVAFFANPGAIVVRTSGGRRVIALPPIPQDDPVAVANAQAQRDQQCRLGRRQNPWQGAFANRNLLLGRKIGPDPYILVNRLLDAPVRAQLPRLTLPVRNSGALLSLERRSVEALFGQGSPNPYAFAGLGPSELDSIPPPAAAPRGLARIPRRP